MLDPLRSCTYFRSSRLSLTCHFLAKHMMQLLWTSGIGWDDPIPEQVHTMWVTRWNSIHTKFEDSPTTYHGRRNSVRTPRLLSQLRKGLCGPVYLRCDSGNWVCCNLVTAKSKGSPLKRMTIPRLELCDAVLAAQLLHYVYELLKQLLTIKPCTLGLIRRPLSPGFNHLHIDVLRLLQIEPARSRASHHHHSGDMFQPAKIQ